MIESINYYLPNFDLLPCWVASGSVLSTTFEFILYLVGLLGKNANVVPRSIGHGFLANLNLQIPMSKSRVEDAFRCGDFFFVFHLTLMEFHSHLLAVCVDVDDAVRTYAHPENLSSRRQVQQICSGLQNYLRETHRTVSTPYRSSDVHVT